ncbi:MAG: hypothetical protein IKW74_04535, partial [Thermoguttaceae bacterium]|nr:hypothetical protein [Thermoguttaceae bacterium]
PVKYSHSPDTPFPNTIYQLLNSPATQIPDLQVTEIFTLSRIDLPIRYLKNREYKQPAGVFITCHLFYSE